MRYTNLPQATPCPRSARRHPDPQQAIGAVVLALAPAGDLSSLGARAPPLRNSADRLESAPDGNADRRRGRTRPAIAADPADGAYAFVPMSGVDRIATVSLQACRGWSAGPNCDCSTAGRTAAAGRARTFARRDALYVAARRHRRGAVIDAHDPAILTGSDGSDRAVPDRARARCRRPHAYVVNTNGSATIRCSPAKSRPAARVDVAAHRSRQHTPSSATLHQLANTRRVVRRRALSQGASHVRGDPRRRQDVRRHARRHRTARRSRGPTPSSDATVTPNLHALALRYAARGQLLADRTSRARVTSTPPPASPRVLAGGALDDRLGVHRAGWRRRSRQTLRAWVRSSTRWRGTGSGFADYGDLLRLSGYESAGADRKGASAAVRVRRAGPAFLGGKRRPAISGLESRT